MIKRLTGFVLFPSLVVLVLFLGLSCTGTNPASPPFLSTVSFVDPPGDIGIPPNTQVLLDVSAVVLDPDGLPLNDVKVTWKLTFANQNDLVYDTDGDGIADSRALQFVDPDECQEVGLDCSLVSSEFYVPFGALKDSPIQKLTNNRGVTRMLILAFGDFPVDPASLEVSIGTDADVVEFSVTNP
jgi:hypothetical protein